MNIPDLRMGSFDYKDGRKNHSWFSEGLLIKDATDVFAHFKVDCHVSIEFLVISQL